MSSDKRCYTCVHCALFDEGYSNWTVESTRMDCLLDKNPNFPVDESESWKDLGTADHDVFRVAESCGFYLYTPQIQHRIDVDGEALEDYKDQPELYDLIQTHY